MDSLVDRALRQYVSTMTEQELCAINWHVAYECAISAVLELDRNSVPQHLVDAAGRRLENIDVAIAGALP